MLKALEAQVLAIYLALDGAVQKFARRTGLACPDGCGYCCLSEKVEATVLECLPLAFALFRAGQAEEMLQALEQAAGDKRCILYRPENTARGLWGCSRYGHRAVVCRLFGFAGNPDRHGTPQLAMCRIMKETQGFDASQIVCQHPQSPMPLFINAGLQITALHPGLGTARMPINTAIREAIMKVGMVLDLNNNS